DNSQFNSFIDEWLRSHPDLKKSTVRHYGQVMQLYVRPKLGGLMLARIVADNVQTLYDELQSKKIAASTVGLVHTLLRSVFKLAMMRRRIRENPMDGVKSPRGKRLAQEQRRKRESRVMAPEQVAKFLKAAEETRLGALFAVAFHTGCRPGELLGLRWDDLDVEARTIRIRQIIKWDVGGKWYLDDPKSEAGRRALRLDDGMVARLAEHRRRQLEE